MKFRIQSMYDNRQDVPVRQSKASLPHVNMRELYSELTLLSLFQGHFKAIWRSFILYGMRAISLFVLSFFASVWVAAQPGEANLFSSEDVIELTIKTNYNFEETGYAPFKEKVRELYSGALTYQDARQVYNIPIQLQARGGYRASYCDFKPFKLFIDKSVNVPLFDGLKKEFKVVTHCHNSNVRAAPEQILFREYLMYKMQEAAGVPALKVRLAKIRYLNISGKLIAYNYAFFIEHVSDLVKRDSNMVSQFKNKDYIAFIQKMFKVDIAKLDNEERGEYQDQFNPTLTKLVDIDFHIRNALIQRLFLNIDWSGTFSDHNIRTVLLKNNLYASVHYDFDLSEIAATLDSLDTSLISDRNSIGDICDKDSDRMVLADQKKTACAESMKRVLLRKDEILNTINSFSLLDEKDKSRLIIRTETFFEALKLELEARP